MTTRNFPRWARILRIFLIHILRLFFPVGYRRPEGDDRYDFWPDEKKT